MKLVHVAAAVMAAAISIPVSSEPRVPGSDEAVLERLTSRRDDPFSRETAALHAQLVRDPLHLDAAVRLAERYVDRSRQTGDPRYLGRAQAVLAPWWANASPPTPVLLLRATIRQSQHAFDPAITDLQEVVRREPRNPQAWLTLSTVQNVIGRRREARASCDRLTGLALPVLVVGCRAGIMSTRDAATVGRSELLSALAAAPGAPREIHAWAHGLAGELAELAGNTTGAEASYRRALAITPDDNYTLAALADLLLAASRPADVLALLKGDRAADGLQLRRVIAAMRADSPSSATEAANLKARFAAAAARGDRVHLREESRFILEVEREPRRALDLALENWRTQKEPADARLVLQAAAAAREARRAYDVVRWIAEARLEGDAIEAALSKLRAL